MENDDLGINILKGAVFFNSSTSLDPSVSSTGFVTSSLAYRTLGSDVSSRVSEDFLVNSRLIRGDAETSNSILYYFEEHSSKMLSMDGEESAVDSIKLPANVKFNIDYQQVINSRRSVRSFSGDSIDFSYLASILRLSAGISGKAKVDLMSQDDPITLNFRVTPSGGGLFPIDVYVLATKVDGLEQGLYRYRARYDDLVLVNPNVNTQDIINCISMPEDMLTVSKANAIFFTVARPWKSMRKYGNRGMRFVFIETGSITQHINLTATALGLGSCDCASVYDDEIHKIFSLDGIFSTLTHAVVVGCPVK